MSGIAKGVSGAVGGIVDAVSGKKPTTTGSNTSSSSTQNELAPQSQVAGYAENVSRQELDDLSNGLAQLFNKAGGNSEEIDNLFKSALTKFATGTGQPTPDQVAQATSYVDQTFTAPAQTQYDRFLNQAQNTISGRAAQLGRGSQDASYQREFAGAASSAAQDLSNQRGTLIGQRADYLANQLPQNQLSALNAGSQYFNTPLNQAINNRLSLLNASTAQQNLGLQGQIAGGKIVSNASGNTSSTAPSAGLGSQIAGIGSSLGDLGTAYSKAGGLSGILGSNKVTPQPISMFI